MTSTAVAFTKQARLFIGAKVMAVYFLSIQPCHHHLVSVPFRHQEIASPAIRLPARQLGSRYFWFLVIASC